MPVRMSAGKVHSHSLPHGMRLRVQADFRRLKQDGMRLSQGCMVVNWMNRNSDAGSRLAVITSKRIGGAVERSRARRLLREAFRLHRSGLAFPVDMVLVARQSITGKTLQGVEKDLLSVWKRGGLLKAQ